MSGWLSRINTMWGSQQPAKIACNVCGVQNGPRYNCVGEGNNWEGVTGVVIVQIGKAGTHGVGWEL